MCDCVNVKKHDRGGKKTNAQTRHIIALHFGLSFLTLSSETLCFSSCLFKALPREYPVCSDWSAHTRLTQHRLQQQSSCAKAVLTC